VQRHFGLAQRECPARVRDRRFDLAAMTDDPGVLQEPIDVALAEPPHALRIEIGERNAKRLALAQDRQPRESRLKAFETEPLEQAALVRHRSSPLVIVVVVVRRILRRPAANRLRQLRP
jgi:hypothetical protein